jgi:hypothetical protein
VVGYRRRRFVELSRVPASRAGVFTGVLPVSAVLLSYAILGESFPVGAPGSGILRPAGYLAHHTTEVCQIRGGKRSTRVATNGGYVVSRLTFVNLGICRLIEGERSIASDPLHVGARYRSRPRSGRLWTPQNRSLTMPVRCDVCHVELTTIFTTGRHESFLDSP